MDKVLVRKILEHALDFSWKISRHRVFSSLRLDERREYALHVWAPERCIGVPPIHDHPFDFVSRIIAGELTNARYVEDPSGVKYLRERYSPWNEDSRTIGLRPTRIRGVETFREGDEYAQAADELHQSHQLPGTVTVIRRAFRDVDELTVCRPEKDLWVSGISRPATSAEVMEITTQALTWF